jgi:hypothetical protein
MVGSAHEDVVTMRDTHAGITVLNISSIAVNVKNQLIPPINPTVEG